MHQWMRNKTKQSAETKKGVEIKNTRETTRERKQMGGNKQKYKDTSQKKGNVREVNIKTKAVEQRLKLLSAYISTQKQKLM